MHIAGAYPIMKFEAQVQNTGEGQSFRGIWRAPDAEKR